MAQRPFQCLPSCLRHGRCSILLRELHQIHIQDRQRRRQALEVLARKQMVNAAMQRAAPPMEPLPAILWAPGARNRQTIAKPAAVPIAPKWIGGPVSLTRLQVA